MFGRTTRVPGRLFGSNSSSVGSDRYSFIYIRLNPISPNLSYFNFMFNKFIEIRNYSISSILVTYFFICNFPKYLWKFGDYITQTLKVYHFLQKFIFNRKLEAMGWDFFVPLKALDVDFCNRPICFLLGLYSESSCLSARANHLMSLNKPNHSK